MDAPCCSSKLPSYFFPLPLPLPLPLPFFSSFPSHPSIAPSTIFVRYLAAKKSATQKRVQSGR